MQVLEVGQPVLPVGSEIVAGPEVLLGQLGGWKAAVLIVQVLVRVVAFERELPAFVFQAVALGDVEPVPVQALAQGMVGLGEIGGQGLDVP